MLCILFTIWNTLDTCSWLENVCGKGAFKQKTHAKIQLKEKKVSKWLLDFENKYHQNKKKNRRLIEEDSFTGSYSSAHCGEM